MALVRVKDVLGHDAGKIVDGNVFGGNLKRLLDIGGVEYVDQTTVKLKTADDLLDEASKVIKKLEADIEATKAENALLKAENEAMKAALAVKTEVKKK